MTNIQMEDGSSASHFSQSRLEKVESALGIKFPNDYLDFLRTANGGVPVKKYFRFHANELVVERFLSLVDNYQEDGHGKYDIEVVWSQIESRLTDGLVPFAALFGGDFLCFDFCAEEFPTVVLWNHDLSREDAPSTSIVAHNFNSFLKVLEA